MKIKNSLYALIVLAFFNMGNAYSQTVLAQNDDAFIISSVNSPVAKGILHVFTFGLSSLVAPSETSKQKNKWSKIIEVAKSSGCTALAVGSTHHDDPEIAIRGFADSKGHPTFLRSNGAHLNYADPYNNGGYWSTVNVSLNALNTMFICARTESTLHSSFKTISKLENDLKLEGMLD